MAEGADEEEIQFLRTVSDAASVCSGLIKEIVSRRESYPRLYSRTDKGQSDTFVFLPTRL